MQLLMHCLEDQQQKDTYAITFVMPNWLQEVEANYEANAKAYEIIVALLVNGSSKPETDIGDKNCTFAFGEHSGIICTCKWLK